jgi:SAM-dependent methyltransferase
MAISFQADAAKATPGFDSALVRLQLRCPVCLQEMAALNPAELSNEPACGSCGFVILSRNGIWRALAPGREDHFRQFVREYESVRSQEGRGCARPDFYLALPYEDTTGRNTWQWKIRGRSLRFLESAVLPEIERQHPLGLDILDLGAGNGWMSYRLALRGHRPLAIDLLVNEEDGLGAARHFASLLPVPLPRFQAEMDRLPFAASQFDLVIFNASFHYSEDYERTLRESCRCLRPGGHLLIVDSPFYKREKSGQQMLEERRAEFQKKYGFPADSLRSGEYLTRERLQMLARSCGLTWRTLRPWYGLGWALRPLKARLLRRREPSRFFIFWAAVASL